MEEKEEEDKKCLHCGKGEPSYCEECYQKLIGENAKMQEKIQKIEKHYVPIVEIQKIVRQYGDTLLTEGDKIIEMFQKIKKIAKMEENK